MTTEFKLKDLKINPEYEKLVPRLPEYQFNGVVESMKEKGYDRAFPISVKKVVTKAGVVVLIVLDGHHRVRACRITGQEPTYIIKEFKDELEEKLFVIDANMKRRQLNKFGISELALKKKPIWNELAKRNMSSGGKLKGKGKGVRNLPPLKRVNDLVARDAGVSRDTISKVEIILQKADKDDLEKVRSGKRTINQVVEHIRKREVRQRLLAESTTPLAQFPYNDECNLILGDFRSKIKDIPDNSIDIAIIDPPYKGEGIQIYYELAKAAFPVLKAGSGFLVYAPISKLDVVMELIKSAAGFKYWGTFAVVHSGKHGKLHQRNMFVTWKPILWFVKGDKSRALDLDIIPDIIFSQATENMKGVHPWEQSIVEAEHIIKHLTVKGMTVLDLCMGSGTTGIAARKLERRFIGMEINEDTFRIATARLTAQNVVQLS
jgi:DNA modification methylase